MRKLFVLSAAVLAIAATPVMADNHGGDKGKKFEKHDTNGDGVISQDEFLTHAKERFSKMDANGDGEVSKEEGKAAMEKKRAEKKERRSQKSGE